MRVWIIEKADSEHPGCVIPGEALGFINSEAPLWGPYEQAMRFPTKETAEFAARFLVPAADTVAVEHLFIEPETNNATKRLLKLDASLFARTHVRYSWFGSEGDRMGFPCGLENEVGEWLYGLVAMVKPDWILETGTRSGVSTRYMGLALKDWHERGRIITIERDGYCRELAAKKFTDQGFANIHSILGDSLTYQPPQGVGFGLLFLDSEPAYRYAELVQFWPALAVGGVAVIHDMAQVESVAFGPVPDLIAKGLKDGSISAMSWPNDTGLTMFQKKAGQA